MNIIIHQQKLDTNLLAPFTPVFDMILVSTNDGFKDNHEFALTSKNIKKLFNVINFSWDGQILWFKKAHQDKVLSTLNEWFNIKENHRDVDDNGISNCLLIKYTPNGITVIDTQFDMSSNLNDFLKKLNIKYPEIKYVHYSDCHLIDNLYLGRDTIDNEFEILYLLYKENIIDSSFLFNGFIHCEDSQLLPNDKDIVITGTFPIPREELKQLLIDVGMNVKDTINKDSWLWTGLKVGQEKINKANKAGCLISSISDLVEIAYKNYVMLK